VFFSGRQVCVSGSLYTLLDEAAELSPMTARSRTGAPAEREISADPPHRLAARWPAASSAAGPRGLLVIGGFILASAVLIDAGTSFAGAPALHDLLLSWVRGEANNDSWAPMIRAYAWFKEAHATTLYQDLFFTQHLKFQYPPTALLPLAAIDALWHPATVRLLNAGNWLVVVLVALTTDALVLSLARRSTALPATSPLLVAATGGIAALATIAFYPIICSYLLGQVQTALDLAFALACLCWLGGRRFAAGMLIGAICLVKPQFSLFLAWGALRREGSLLIGWCAVVLPCLAVSIALFGLANHLDYFSTLKFLSAHGEAFYPNQSPNGLLNRLLHNGESLVWSPSDFPPYHPVVYFGTMASSLALILPALFWRAQEREAGGLLDFMTAALTFTIASPIAWEHHYGVLPPIFLALVFALLGGRGRWGSWAVLAVTYLLAANFFPVVNRTADGPFNFLQSYLLLASLAVLFLLYRARALSSRAEPFAAAGKVAI